VSDAAEGTSPTEVADHDTPSRRCWRCLQTFACTADDILPGPTEWWLCDPCSQKLIGKPGR
jgi:hypothetical protein